MAYQGGRFPVFYSGVAGTSTREEIQQSIVDRAHALYEEREEQFGSELMRKLERMILLRTVDRHWMDNIDAMDELRNGMYLRAYAQHDPVVEYRNEAYDMFNAMTESICEETTRLMLTFQIRRQEDVERKQTASITAENVGSGEKSLGPRSMPNPTRWAATIPAPRQRQKV